MITSHTNVLTIALWSVIPQACQAGMQYQDTCSWSCSSCCQLDLVGIAGRIGETVGTPPTRLSIGHASWGGGGDLTRNQTHYWHAKISSLKKNTSEQIHHVLTFIATHHRIICWTK